MSQSTLTFTLNYTGQPNVSYVLTSADFPDAVTAAQSIVKNGGFWTNTAVGGPLNTFYPASAILQITVT